MSSLGREPMVDSRSLVDELDAEERQDWYFFEEMLKRHHGEIVTSQTQLLEDFNRSQDLDISISTLRRRLKRFETLKLISTARLGRGRNSRTKITLISYEEFKGAFSNNQSVETLSSPLAKLTGCLDLDSPFYLERKADEVCWQIFQAQRESRFLLRLKGGPQSGKTSLLIRIQVYLETLHNHHCVRKIDLVNGRDFTPEAFDDLDQFLFQFAKAIQREFKDYIGIRGESYLPLEDTWRSDLTPGINCEEYLAEYVFNKIPVPTTLIIDGLDHILGHKAIQTPFCNLLRTWNEERMKNVGQGKIIWPNIIIAYSTEPYPAYGIIGSVFQNVGIEVNLTDFTAEQISQLAKKYCFENWNDTQADALLQLVGGHPALVQEALYHLSQDKSLTIEDLGGRQLGTRFFQDHLLNKLTLLNPRQPSDLLDCFKALLKEENCQNEYAKFQLEKAGLIRYVNGEVTVIELYKKYFRKVLELVE